MKSTNLAGAAGVTFGQWAASVTFGSMDARTRTELGHLCVFFYMSKEIMTFSN